MIARLSASLVFALAFFTALGHVCELPLEIAVSHSHEGSHEATDHRAGESDSECDVVLAVRASAPVTPGGGVAVPAAPPSLVYTATLAVATAVPDISKSPPRPPLFLLHAALLI